MNFTLNLFLVCLLLSFSAPIFAATPTPTPTPHVQFTNEFTTDNDPNISVGILKNFIHGFDSILGGFIFYTPDPLNNKIILQDKSELPGVTKYRNMFNEIAIPTLAIIIGGIAVTKIGSENTYELKSFALRLLLTIVLFITVPSVLSYSIQFNNLLVQKITTTQQFTGFLNDYLDKANVQIQNGADSEQFGIPHFDFSLVGGVLKFLGQMIIKVFLFVITFLFLLLGLLYIGFQFVIRFASLLFLGVIYPVILPFMLGERTQNIVHTYFKSWFTFLIMQPAFVLGFAITTDIFTNILNAKGPSVGLLFFYTGFLFFLGGVNLLVGRIFGDVWTVMATNMLANVSSRTLMSPVQSSFKDFKRGLVGGNGNMSAIAGQHMHNKIASKFHKNPETNPINENGSKLDTKQPKQQISVINSGSHNTSTQINDSIPQFSKELNQKGLQVQIINQKQGIVSLSGEAYRYSDPKSGLTSIYSNRIEAIQDGVPEGKLLTTRLDKAQFIDLSTFNRKNPGPHNLNAMEEARKQGKDLHYAYVTSFTHPERIQKFLQISKPRTDALGVQGVIVKRQGMQTSDHIIRMYTPYEKH